jgi:hypothetical protein
MEKFELMAALSRIQDPRTDTQKLALAYADALVFPRYNRGKPVSNARVRHCLAILRREFGDRVTAH